MTTVVKPPKRDRAQELIEAMRRVSSAPPTDVALALLVINEESVRLRHAGEHERANALTRARVTLAKALRNELTPEPGEGDAT